MGTSRWKKQTLHKNKKYEHLVANNRTRVPVWHRDQADHLEIIDDAEITGDGKGFIVAATQSYGY